MPRSTRLDTTVLDAIIRNSDENTAQAVAKAAFTVEGYAKIAAPVDTGALRASIYTSLKTGTQQPVSSPAEERIELPRPTDNATAYVGPSVEYGAAVELGTHRRAGTPYLLPALRRAEQAFRGMVARAVTNGK